MKKVVYLILVTAIGFLSACKKDLKEEEKLPKAIIIVNSTAAPFDTVYVDGTSSQNASNFEWTVTNFNGDVSVYPSAYEGKMFFIPKVNGSYQVMLNVTSDGKYNDTKKSVTVSGALKIGGTLTNNKTLTNINMDFDSCDYFLKEDLVVPNGMSLSIDDGVKICAAEGVGIIVDGTIYVNGSSYGVVIESIGNNWKGIYIKGKNSVLKSLIIDGAGSSSFSTDTDEKAAIYAKNSFLANNITVKNSQGYGIVLSDRSVSFKDQSSYITFENNTSGPGIFSFPTILKYGVTFGLGNETMGTYLKIYGEPYYTSQVFLRNLFPYLLLGDIKVLSMVVEGGTEVYCADGIGIEVVSNFQTTSSGSSTVIEGITKTAGSWKGIFAGNVISLVNTTIRYAGSDTWSTSKGDFKAGVICEGKIDLNNCIINNNVGFGVGVFGQTTQSLNNSEISYNSSGAVLTVFNRVDDCANSTGVKFLGYGAQPIITIVPGYGVGINGSWPKIAAAVASIDYKFLSSQQGIVYSSSTDWTIEKGVHIECEANVGIRLYPNKVFTAQGTASEKIVFTGTSHTAGHWRGIYADYNSKIVCDFLEVQYGGGDVTGTYKGSFNVHSNIQNSSTVTNCVFLNGGTYDLYFTNAIDKIGIKNTSNNNTYVTSN